MGRAREGRQQQLGVGVAWGVAWGGQRVGLRGPRDAAEGSDGGGPRRSPDPRGWQGGARGPGEEEGREAGRREGGASTRGPRGAEEEREAENPRREETFLATLPPGARGSRRRPRSPRVASPRGGPPEGHPGPPGKRDGARRPADGLEQRGGRRGSRLPLDDADADGRRSEAGLAVLTPRTLPFVEVGAVDPIRRLCTSAAWRTVASDHVDVLLVVRSALVGVLHDGLVV